jgi:hypothetical protein
MRGSRSLAVAAGILAACAASTELTHVQVVAQQQRVPVKNVLVIGLFQDPGARQAYETDMVAALRKAGAQAQAAGDLFPPGTIPTREQIKQMVQQKGFDGAVVGHLADRRTETSVYSEPVFYDWYGYAAPTMYAPTVRTSTTIVVQTRVFATSTGQAQFAASSQTIDPASAAEVAKPHAELVVGAMQKDGLVPRPPA